MILESGACGINPIFRLISGTTATQYITTGNYSVFYTECLKQLLHHLFYYYAVAVLQKKNSWKYIQQKQKMEHIPYNIFSIILTNALIIIGVWEILNGRK